MIQSIALPASCLECLTRSVPDESSARPARLNQQRFPETRSRRGLFAFRSPKSHELKTARAFEFPLRPASESGQAQPSPRRRALQSQAKSQTCVRPTRSCAFLAGNNDRSLPQDKSERRARKAFYLQKNHSDEISGATSDSKFEGPNCFGVIDFAA